MHHAWPSAYARLSKLFVCCALCLRICVCGCCGQAASEAQAGGAQAGGGALEALQASEMLVAVMEELKAGAAATQPLWAVLATAEDAARLHPSLRQVWRCGAAPGVAVRCCASLRQVWRCGAAPGVAVLRQPAPGVAVRCCGCG